ncbi:MarR family winged helix-turn-helix transcriptional regulator [Streptomyces sp. JJ38]|uniref:MarR family winged helix-turn-helix transcriptional regulator n=1 Tax=Streptomyces sp. JJ38 TaxID=2738128 RepID=UPI001C59A3A1|nr:MarR family transcriptional regulator [Streptomyces sp. JJ38]MBW1597395.1 MarR family transcriptional regulator [Streptomyces sp. JJ38]
MAPSDEFRVDSNVLAQQVYRLGRLLDSATASAAARVGLTRAEADVLRALLSASDHRLRPTALATACGLSSGGTSNIIQRLARSGFVNREANDRDGRSNWVQLTPEGAELTRVVAEAVTDRHTRLLAPLPGDTAACLLETLNTTLEHIDETGARTAAGRGH